MVLFSKRRADYAPPLIADVRHQPMRGLPLAFLASSILACTFSPDVSNEEAAMLKAEAQVLLAAHASHSAIIPESKWPQAIRQVADPVSVVLKSDGIYVTTSEVFVESKGLFFPKDPSFMPISGSDPAFTEVIPGVYKFHIKG